MVLAAVTFQGTRVDAAQVAGGIWTDLGGGKAADEPDFVYQGGAAVSEKVGTSEGGVALDMTGEPTATFDLETPPQIVIFKHIATNPAAMNVKGATGGILEIGSGGFRVDYHRFYVVGGDTYTIKGGWLITPVDPNTTPSESVSPPVDLSIVNYWGWAGDFGSSSRAENMALDAVDYIAYGEGLLLVSGSGADPDGTFQDFIDEDEGITANRWGIVSTQDGILFVTGTLNIGSATETDFSDSGQVIIFPDAEFLSVVGFFGIGFNLAHANSVMSISGTVFKGRGSTAGNVDTRPDYTVVNASGTLALTSNTFDNFRLMTLTAGVTLLNCILINGDTVLQVGAIIDGCTFSGGTHGDGDAYLDADDLDLVSNSTFNFSDGHAIEYTGAATASFTLTDVDFVGYGADGTNDAALFNPNTSGTLTIAASGVTGLTVRTASGGTTIINNAVTVRVEGVTEGTAVVVIAAETVGSITDGDVIFEGLADANGVVEDTGFNYEGAFDPSGLDVTVRARNSGFPSAAIADDDGVQVDETTASNSTTEDVMTLMPAVPVANEDRYLFGHNEEFGQLKIEVSQAGVGVSPVITWQYWNGAWVSLSGVTDGTDSFQNAGVNTVSWTIPGDWIDTTENGQGPFRFVRAALTSGNFATTPPLGRKSKLDVTRYRPFEPPGGFVISSTGLTVVASWVVDAISSF